jgi:hypothetical protein
MTVGCLTSLILLVFLTLVGCPWLLTTLGFLDGSSTLLPESDRIQS